MYPHSNRHIPQPPHSAGVSYNGLRPRIDTNQIPSPVENIEADRQHWQSLTFQTLGERHAPLSTTNFIAVDQGNSSPKFVRASTWAVPSSSRLAKDCNIPICAVFQPFAQLQPQEEPIPLIDTGENGPARCDQCRTYVNPWGTWTGGGSRWKCNLCHHESEVAQEYFCNLDQNGVRLDHLRRPELFKGTVDFTAPMEYWASNPPEGLVSSFSSIENPPTGPREPKPMRYVFALDVSQEAVTSGLLETACAALLSTLLGVEQEDGSAPPEPCIPPASEIAIITFDRTIHYYNLSSDQVPMLVIPDIDDVFVPLRDGLFVLPSEHRASIEHLLTSLPMRFSDSVVREAPLGAALNACQACLVGRGGQAVVFQSTLPKVGPGALAGQPNEGEIYDTEKEKTLHMPRNDQWRVIADGLAENGVGVNLFLGNREYIDVGSIGVVASLTGGEIFFHPRFQPVRDRAVILSQFRRLVSRMTGYNCNVRIRCSKGLRAVQYYGNFYQRSATDVEFAVLHADAALSVVFEHNGKLSARENVFYQAAALYTSVTGERRVRICNLSLQVVDLASNVFQYADMETVVHHLAQHAISLLPSQRLLTIREDLTENCSSLLLGYRLQCSAGASPSQLIIPEVFKSLPIYTLCINKSKPLKGRTVSSDVRNFYAHRMRSMSVRTMIHHLYPQMLALHDLDPEVAVPDAEGRIQMPSLMRNSHVYMEAHGVYMLDNEDVTILWIGANVNPQLLMDLFEVETLHDLDPFLFKLPVLETRISSQVRNILIHREIIRGRSSKLCIARQNLDSAELEFSDMLVEDQNNATLSYVDYLTVIHKQITHVLTEGGSLSGGSVSLRSQW